MIEWKCIDDALVQSFNIYCRTELDAFRADSIEYVAKNKRLNGDKLFDDFGFYSWKDEEVINRYYEICENIIKDIECYPVEKSYWQYVSYEDSWNGERTYGGTRKHEGTDIMSPDNESGVIPIVSMTDGTIRNLGWLRLGGWRIGIVSESGIYYYYAHLDHYAPNLKVGDTVCAGQLIGYMGDSGYGEEGTTGMFDVHLHLGIYMYNEDGKEISVNPYPYLRRLNSPNSFILKNNE